jgi:hypothetical protein
MRLFKLILLSMIFTITLTSFSIDLIVNDKKISTEDYQTKPEIINDRTYVPLRFVSDALGYNVNWDGDSKQVLISNSADPMSNVLPENPEKNLRIVLNGKPMFFPVDYGQPFINSQSITMVPVRGVSEAMKLKVSFTNNTVYISGNTDPDVQTVPVANTNEQEEKQTIKDSYSFDLTIFGEPLATREQLVAYTKDRERSFRVSIPQVYGRPYIEIPDLIDYYLEIGKEYGIRGDIAYLQAIKETNFFQFTGIVQPHQNNYSGIWATGSALTGNEPYNGVSPDKMRFEPGVHGVTFASPRIGVEAQIQHLYAYATTAPLPQGKELLSPRFIYVNRGCAPRWVDLGGKWAYPGYEPSRFSSLQEAFNAGKTYGHSILEDYLAKVLAY